MRKMWSFLLAALALTGCAAAPADALPAAETAETAEMTTTETEEAAAQPDKLAPSVLQGGIIGFVVVIVRQPCSKSSRHAFSTCSQGEVSSSPA